MKKTLIILPDDTCAWVSRLKPIQLCAWQLLMAWGLLWFRNTEHHRADAQWPWIAPTLKEASELALFEQKVQGMFERQPRPERN
jgi:hypothetical protein